MQSFFGTNLVIVLSTDKSLTGDVKKIKDALDLCPQYSRFSLLWIVHKTGQELKTKVDISPDAIVSQFKDLLRDEKISSLKVSALLYKVRSFAQPSSLKKLKSSCSMASVRGTEIFSLKNVVLAVIKDDLELAIKSSRIIPNRK